MSNTPDAVILDIDNTLFDWLGMWHAAFRGMLDVLVKESGVPEEMLIEDFRAIHQRYGTVEYAFSIEELASLSPLYARDQLPAVFAAAIDRYRFERRQHLVLYPGVLRTLEHLKGHGIKLAAYTESLSFYARHRIKNLGLDGVIDCVYSPPDHDIPAWIDLDRVRRYPQTHYELQDTKHHLVPRGSHKPDSRVLLSILQDLDTSPSDAVYVGDSLTRDVLMAKRAGATDIWAAYGAVPNRVQYDLLRRVTHWTETQVNEERRLKSLDVKPSYTLHATFAELSDVVFSKWARHRDRDQVPQRRSGSG